MLRILSAIALMIGFYVLAVAVSFGLLAAVWFMLIHQILYPFPIILAVVTAGVILWSIVPRVDRFAPPGPRLTAEAQPEFFAFLRGVAAETGEEMPAEVYLAGDVNASVAHRGGLVGIGSRRVMTLGLPLLQTLTASQLRSVIVHEFGHYLAGDLKLGVWVYRTRFAMFRTIQNLARTRGGAWTHKPFLLYGNLFMRVTQAIAREREIGADRLAARIAGARSHVEALRITHGAGKAFNVYWASEVMPLLNNGYQPPLGAGFARFVRAEPVAKAIDDELEQELQKGTTDPYDSHPSLKERIAAVADMPDVSPLHDDPPAMSFVRDLPSLERELLRIHGAPELKPIEWHDAPEQVYIPVWRKRAHDVRKAFANKTAADIPAIFPTRQFAELAGVSLLRPDERRPELQASVAMLVATKLLDDGWTCTTSPGEQIVFTKDERSFRPFVAATRSGDEWLAAVREAGIESLPLG